MLLPQKGSVTIEDITDDEAAPADFDVDNMDFDLPADLVPAAARRLQQPPQQPLLMTQEEAVEWRNQQLQQQLVPVAKPSSSSAAHAVPNLKQLQQMQQQQQEQQKTISALTPAMKRWICVYPVYIDKDKSHADGRKVPKNSAVKDPSVVYLPECCMRLGLNCVVEQGKRHPRDALTLGRARVELRDPQGKFRNPMITSKISLLLAVAAQYDAVVETILKIRPHVAADAAFSRSQPRKEVIEAAREADKIAEELSSSNDSGSKKTKKK